MVAWFVIAWCVIGAITMPIVVGWMNAMGDTMERDPVMEIVTGALLGPLPLVLFALYFVLKVIGWCVFKLTRQKADP